MRTPTRAKALALLGMTIAVLMGTIGAVSPLESQDAPYSRFAAMALASMQEHGSGPLSLVVDLDPPADVAASTHRARSVETARAAGVPARRLRDVTVCPEGVTPPHRLCGLALGDEQVIVRFGTLVVDGSDARLSVVTFHGTESKMGVSNQTAVFAPDPRTGSWELVEWIAGATT